MTAVVTLADPHPDAVLADPGKLAEHTRVR